jgi:serine protease AprX
MWTSYLFVALAFGLGSGSKDACKIAPAVGPIFAQQETAKVWVFLSDKGPTERQGCAIQELERAYPPRAIERRKLRRTSPGLFDERDVPVDPEYVCAIAETGARIHVQSSWVNAVSVTASQSQVCALACLPYVTRIEPVRRGETQEAIPLRRAKPRVRPTARGFYGLSEAQLAQIGITNLHARGYTGQGVVIGVLDTGFALTHEAYSDPAHPIHVIAEHDFINNDNETGIEFGDPASQHFHGTAVLGAIAAYKPGELVGGAYDAAFVLAKTEDVTREVPAEEDNYVAGLQFAELHGADVVTSSLGYIAWYDWYDLDGETAVTSIAVNAATANGVVCVTGAGNRGRDNDLPSLMAPGDAFEVLTCGAARPDGDITDFSSNGPTVDGRVKPEVLALGQDVATVDPDVSDAYREFDGTSMATPLVTSAAALIIQAHPTWTVEQVRARLFVTASYYRQHGTFDPEYARGYGLINAFEAAKLPRPASP